MNTEARDEVAAGFRYAHFRADANTGKLLEVASLTRALAIRNGRGVWNRKRRNQKKR